ncbi:MAG: 3-phosphoshikimate 1-carboxyvinyltransferase [Gemmatimonadaceae bacterium]
MSSSSGAEPMNAPTRTVQGTVRVPGDKSISHRALMLSVLAKGPSRIRHILESADVQATAAALRALGGKVPPLGPDLLVEGEGPGFLRSPARVVDCANSGTTTRLMAGIVAGLPGCSVRFEGDASLSRRPMRRVAAPLRAMGASVAFVGADGHEGLPMVVTGAALQAVAWDNPQSSAQVKGALLLAGLTAGVGVTVREPVRSRDHSERMLLARGVALSLEEDGVTLAPGQVVQPLDVDVPGDPSSATFFVALAALADAGGIVLTDVCLNPTRCGAFEILRRMGAVLELRDVREIGGEPVGTIVARPGTLRGTTIGGAEIPSCIDELPMLACVAACADGETVITGAGELRVKESDRISAVVSNLRALGADVEELPDGMRIRGSSRPLRGQAFTHGDHRLAMAFGVLGVSRGNTVVVDDPGCVTVSYPDFWADLGRVVSSAERQPHVPASSPPAVSAPAVAMRGRPEPDLLTSIPSLMPRFVIAIDGPAASGKSSTAQWVAQRLGVRHVDSGAFYRAITYLGIQSGVLPEDWTAAGLLASVHRVGQRLTERSVLPVIDGGEMDEALRGGVVTANVSRVAKLGPVRQWVNAQVRQAATATDVVVDGRDIGTAVFPDAGLKIFMIADPWERARRRLIQRLGRAPSDAEIAEETEALVARDAQDATQSAPARDAITIDTTALTQEEQVDRIVALARAARG